MKKLYITPEVEVTKFNVNTLVLASDNESGPAQIITDPFTEDSQPESETDFNDMPF